MGGINIGARMDEATGRHGLEVQVSTGPRLMKRFDPLRLRWRNEASFGTLPTCDRRLSRHWKPNPASPEDAVSIANRRCLLRADHRVQDCPTPSNRLSGKLRDAKASMHAIDPKGIVYKYGHVFWNCALVSKREQMQRRLRWMSGLRGPL